MGKKRLGIIGGGNIGEAILAGSKRAFTVCVAEQNARRRNYLKRRYKIKCCTLDQLVAVSDVIIIAVKPQDIDSVLKDLCGSIRKNQIAISIAAGITTRFIEKRLGGKVRVVRTMPNMPALIGQGITGVSAGRYAKPGDIRLTSAICSGFGETVIVKEKFLDAVTALSGSGPAYVCLFMECLIQAAKKLGIKEALAIQLITKTFQGSSNLIVQNNVDPRVLRKKVTSKGGTTQAATEVFLQKNLAAVIAQAVKAAERRAKKLSRT